jgi:hypothetical protein
MTSRTVGQSKNDVTFRHAKQSDQASNANTTPVHPRPWDQPLVVAYIELRLHHTTPHTHTHIIQMSSELASYAHGCAFFSATGVIFLVSSTTEEAEWDPPSRLDEFQSTHLQAVITTGVEVMQGLHS